MQYFTLIFVLIGIVFMFGQVIESRRLISRTRVISRPVSLRRVPAGYRIRRLRGGTRLVQIRPISRRGMTSRIRVRPMKRTPIYMRVPMRKGSASANLVNAPTRRTNRIVMAPRRSHKSSTSVTRNTVNNHKNIKQTIILAKTANIMSRLGHQNAGPTDIVNSGRGTVQSRIPTAAANRKRPKTIHGVGPASSGHGPASHRLLPSHEVLPVVHGLGQPMASSGSSPVSHHAPQPATNQGSNLAHAVQPAIPVMSTGTGIAPNNGAGGGHAGGGHAGGGHAAGGHTGGHNGGNAGIDQALLNILGAQLDPALLAAAGLDQGTGLNGQSNPAGQAQLDPALLAAAGLSQGAGTNNQINSIGQLDPALLAAIGSIQGTSPNNQINPIGQAGSGGSPNHLNLGASVGPDLGVSNTALLDALSSLLGPSGTGTNSHQSNNLGIPSASSLSNSIARSVSGNEPVIIDSTNLNGNSLTISSGGPNGADIIIKSGQNTNKNNGINQLGKTLALRALLGGEGELV